MTKSILIFFLLIVQFAVADPLPSWTEGPSKKALLEFIDQVTNPKNPDYVKRQDRIAVFDNDGTLWTSHPIYFQLFFAIDRLRELSKDHPEWNTTQPYKAYLEMDKQAIADAGEKGVVEILMATHAGMTTEKFEQIVKDWLETAKHPHFKRSFTDLVYQPMLELLKYLRAKGFKTFIVSGGGIEFMRPWTEQVYGIPPEQVIGSSIKTLYEVREGKPVLIRLPEVNFIDDKAGKPVGINQYIGKRPILAFGNSDGDLEMLEWTTAGEGKRFAGIIHHTDENREYAYDRDTHFGRLDKALDNAKQKGWTIVDMKEEWKVIYPFQLNGTE